MRRLLYAMLAWASLMAAGIAPAQAASRSLVSIQTPRGVKQALILIKPDKTADFESVIAKYKE